MNEVNVDVAVIGAGTAGLNARRAATSAGASAVMIESGPYGTTCARVGCMPSKLLIAAADVAHDVGHAGRFGIEVSETGWRVNGAKVLERVRRERDRFVGFVVEATEAIDPAQRLRGEARFTGPTTLEVGGATRVNARSVVVASGSSPWLPAPFDAIAEHVLVNDDVFELTELPSSLAVVGTGIIGLELGQAMSRLGVDVQFFNPFKQLGMLSDPFLVDAVDCVLCHELNLSLGASIREAQPVDGGVRLAWTDGQGVAGERVFEQVLVAAGRRPNLANLDFHRTGLELNDKGMPHWDPRTTQCGDTPIFLAGDVSGHLPLLHEASDEGRIAGLNAARFPDVAAHVRRTELAVAFTEPQMAVVGRPYSRLDRDAIEIGEVSYFDQGRARVMGRNQGRVRIYASRASCTIIGAEMFGPRMEHLAHLLAWAVQQNLSVQRALEMPFYHPVLEEGLRTALRDLAEKLKVTGSCRDEDLADVPAG